MSNTSWVYYRIFQNDPQDFSQLISILNEVVTPVVNEFEDNILHFHFLSYSGPYKTHVDEDGVMEPLPNVSAEAWVAFIRFRLLVDEEIEQQVRGKIEDLSSVCVDVRGYELPNTNYDVRDDLGFRFGHTRIQEMMDLMEAAARLALNFAKDEEPLNPHPQGQGGPQGAVHLVANTLQFILIPVDDGILCRNWGREVKIQSKGTQLI